MKEKDKSGLVRWNPFEELGWWFPSVSRTSDGDLLEDFWGRRGSAAISPATDITEGDSHYIVTAELPGMKRGDGVLTVSLGKTEERKARVIDVKAA